MCTLDRISGVSIHGCLTSYVLAFYSVLVHPVCVSPPASFPPPISVTRYLILPCLRLIGDFHPSYVSCLTYQKSPADYNCGGEVKKREPLRGLYPIPRAAVSNTLNIKNPTLNIIFSLHCCSSGTTDIRRIRSIPFPVTLHRHLRIPSSGFLKSTV